MKSFAFPTSPSPRSVSSRFTYLPPLGRYTAPRAEERESDVGKKFGELDYSSVLTCASFTPRERSLSGSGWKIYIYIYTRICDHSRGKKIFYSGCRKKKGPRLRGISAEFPSLLPSGGELFIPLHSYFQRINNIAYIINILQVGGCVIDTTFNRLTDRNSNAILEKFTPNRNRFNDGENHSKRNETVVLPPFR